MATKPTNKTKPTNPASPDRGKLMAKAFYTPECTSAGVLDAFNKSYVGDEVNFNDLSEMVRDTTKLLKQDNPMEYVERLLLSQSIALNGMFVGLARKATAQEYMKNKETYLRLALKAQSQCRATLESLALVRNPPVVFAKTANIAQNQQINNGSPPTPEQPVIKEALTQEHGEPLPVNPTQSKVTV